MGFDPAVALDSTLTQPVLDPLGSLAYDAAFDSPASTEPPLGLQLRKSESFLDLINEHIKHAESAAMAS